MDLGIRERVSRKGATDERDWQSIKGLTRDRYRNCRLSGYRLTSKNA